MTISANTLLETIIGLMIENAIVKAAAAPIFVHPSIGVDCLGDEFDKALDEINQNLATWKMQPLSVDDSFKKATIESLLQRMEAQGRVMYMV